MSACEHDLMPLPLDVEKLIQRIKNGGQSGRFLGDAFISAYRLNAPFNHSLSELSRLDADAFRLFHQILHIRHVPNWNDDALYAIEQQITALLKQL